MATHATVVSPTPIWGEAREDQTQVVYKGLTFPVDTHILPLVRALWAAGIDTESTCCGHSKRYAYIIVMGSDAEVMVAKEVLYTHGFLCKQVSLPVFTRTTRKPAYRLEFSTDLLHKGFTNT